MIPIMVTTFGCSLIPTLIQNPLKLVRKSKQIANTLMFIATDGTRDNPWALTTADQIAFLFRGQELQRLQMNKMHPITYTDRTADHSMCNPTDKSHAMMGN